MQGWLRWARGRASRLPRGRATFGGHAGSRGRRARSDWRRNLVGRAAPGMREPSRPRRQRLGAREVARAARVLRSRCQRFIEAVGFRRDGRLGARGRAQSRDFAARARGGTNPGGPRPRGARTGARCSGGISGRGGQGLARARRSHLRCSPGRARSLESGIPRRLLLRIEPSYRARRLSPAPIVPPPLWRQGSWRCRGARPDWMRRSPPFGTR